MQTLARGQADLGHEVCVLCVNHANENGKDVTHSKWETTSTIIQMDRNVRVERVGRWFGISRLEICPELVKKISEASAHADIVHLHTPNPLMLFAWWLSGNRQIPLVVTHHSDVIKQKFLQSFVRPFEKKVYRLAEKIFTTSPGYLEGSDQLKGYEEKVSVLPLGIDLDPYLHPTDSILSVSKSIRNINNKFWLMVGRLIYYKGYHVALEALTKVEGNLVVVGTGPLEEELKAKAKTLGISHRIEWIRNVSQDKLIALYHAAAALWFPSIARSEGFGLVQIEAMASGCPVINTYVPSSGVSWVSLHGFSGLTVGLENPNELAEMANELIENTVLRTKLSAGARERAQDLFDASKMTLKSLEYYSKVVS